MNRWKYWLWSGYFMIIVMFLCFIMAVAGLFTHQPFYAFLSVAIYVVLSIGLRKVGDYFNDKKFWYLPAAISLILAICFLFQGLFLRLTGTNIGT